MVRPKGRRGSTRQPENSKRAHLSAPALQTPPKFHEKTNKRGRMKTVAGEGKKSAKFWASHPSAPPLFLCLGLHLSGPYPLWSKNSTSKNWPKSKLAEVENGRSRNWPKSTALGLRTSVRCVGQDFVVGESPAEEQDTQCVPRWLNAWVSQSKFIVVCQDGS